MEFLEILKETDGFFALSEVKRPDNYDAKLTGLMDLLANKRGLAPHRREFAIREAMTTSDFPYLFGDVLNREVLAGYKAVDATWKPIFQASTVTRIYPQVGGRRFAVTGGDQVLDVVGEKGEYPASKRAESKFDIYVRKYGRQFDISWESLINDDLGALTDTAERFARAAARTEHRLAVATFARNAALFTAGNANMSANALTIANLEIGIAAMRQFRDAGGEAIQNNPKYLVVPPALEFTARQILTSAHKYWIGQGQVAAIAGPYPDTNVIPQVGLQLIVEPYLPIIDATDGATGWYLFADVKDIAALEAAHLRGHETPEICMKSSDKVSIGGGLITPLSGDFATDNVFYRVRVVFGTATLDWRACYMGGSTL